MTAEKVDTALACLIAIGRIHRIIFEPEALRRNYSMDGQPMDKL